MLSFFLAFSLGPKEGRICAATSDFLATLIFLRHGGKWGQCRLLLADDPQPRHEVAVGVFGPSPPPPHPFKGSKYLRGVGVKACNWAPPLSVPIYTTLVYSIHSPVSVAPVAKF